MQALRIDSLKFKGYVGQSVKMDACFNVLIEDSTFSNIFEQEPTINIISGMGVLVIKDSFMIHTDERGRPLLIIGCAQLISVESTHIFIENTNFKLTQIPSPNQPAAIHLFFRLS